MLIYKWEEFFLNCPSSKNTSVPVNTVLGVERQWKVETYAWESIPFPLTSVAEKTASHEYWSKDPFQSH